MVRCVVKDGHGEDMCVQWDWITCVKYIKYFMLNDKQQWGGPTSM